VAPWWPDASGLNVVGLGDLSPGFSTENQNLCRSLALVYEGKLTRYWTDAPSMFRSLLPSLEMRKSPWVNRYMYALPFDFQHGHMAAYLATGEADLDKILNIGGRAEAIRIAALRIRMMCLVTKCMFGRRRTIFCEFTVGGLECSLGTKFTVYSCVFCAGLH
jgi:hypothetical protein